MLNRSTAVFNILYCSLSTCKTVHVLDPAIHNGVETYVRFVVCKPCLSCEIGIDRGLLDLIMVYVIIKRTNKTIICLPLMLLRDKNVIEHCCSKESSHGE